MIRFCVIKSNQNAQNTLVMRHFLHGSVSFPEKPVRVVREACEGGGGERLAGA